MIKRQCLIRLKISCRVRIVRSLVCRLPRRSEAPSRGDVCREAEIYSPYDDLNRSFCTRSWRASAVKHLLRSPFFLTRADGLFWGLCATYNVTFLATTCVRLSEDMFDGESHLCTAITQRHGVDERIGLRTLTRLTGRIQSC